MLTRPKVLFVSHGHPRIRPGGAELHSLELYEGFRRFGTFEPLLVARAGRPHAPNDAPHDGTQLAALGNDPNQYLLYTSYDDYDFFLGADRSKSVTSRFFRELLLAHRPDVVHFQHTLFLGYELIRVARQTLPSASIVYTLHEYVPICHRDGQMVRATDGELCLEASPRRCHECFPEIAPAQFFLRQRYIQSHFRHVDAFLAPSRFLADRYVDWGIPRERVQIEEYGRPSPARHAETDERPVRNRFSFFGQLSAYKGADVLLRAAELLTGAGADLSITIHGANLDLTPEPYRSAVAAQLEAGTGGVRFAGAYTPAELPDLMRQTDWVIVPSTWWENSPLVIQEAFMHGRPVICSGVGGMAEKVTHGVNGLHVPVGDATALAETMQRAAADPDLWQRLRAGIPEVYTVEESVRSIEALYSRLLQARRGGCTAERPPASLPRAAAS